MSQDATPTVNPPPSFSSFPSAPVFDSFPVASTSKAVAASGSRDSEKHRHKNNKSGKEQGHSKNSEIRLSSSRDAETGSSRANAPSDRTEREQSKSHRHRGRGEHDRDRYEPDSRERSKKTRYADEDKRHTSKRRHRSSSLESENRKSRKDVANAESRYSMPNLAYGELSRIVTLPSEDRGEGDNSEPDYKLFAIDRKGDQEVRKYGKPYHGSIPRYRRTGQGHIVGLPGDFRITRDSSKAGDVLHVVAGRDLSKGASLLDRAVRNRITDRTFKRLVLAPTTKAIQSTLTDVIRLDIDTSYIPLPKFTSASDKIAKLEHETGQDYRSVAGAVKPSDIREDDDEWDELEEAQEEGAENFDEYLKRRNTEFERKLRSNPDNVEAWLEFVTFQDSVHNFTSDSTTKAAKRAMSQVSRRSLAEIKVSILDRALSQSGNENATKLQLALLHHGADIWDTKELMRRWMVLLKSQPDELDVWLAYLTFRQTNATFFSVQEVVDIYADCLLRIAQQILRRPRGSSERGRLEENYVYLFLRACLLLRQSSYLERALAAFQAMLELNFFIPDEHRAEIQSQPTQIAPVTSALDALEEYWDSEAPRIGETGAVGWKSSLSTTRSSDGPEQHFVADHATGDPQQEPFERWAKAEQATARRRRRPAKTIDVPDEDIEDDPYATILFSDIRSLLFVISSPDARSQLLYSFLFYLGLPLIPPDTSTISRLSSDTFLHADDLSPSFAARSRAAFWPTHGADEFLRGLIPFDIIGGQAMDPIRTSGIRDPFSLPFKKFPVSPDVMFSSAPRWFCLLDQRERIVELDSILIRNALAQLRTVSKDIFLTLVHFSLESSISPKGAVKVAKATLKVDSKNLLLWDAYARIEQSNGNLKAARNVYCQAVTLSQGFADSEKDDMLLLWRAWAELEWENERPLAALCVLVAGSSTPASVDGLNAIAAGDEAVKPSPAALVRARQHYIRLLDAANAPDSSQALFRHRISVTCSLALLEYLTRGLEACDLVMSKQVAVLKSESNASAEEEEALALQAKFAFRYSQSRSAYRPGTIRTIVERALETFPNNSVFLSLHLFNEVRTRIDNRVRRVLEDYVLRDDKVSTEGWLFAIYAEMHLHSRSYNPQTVRALFERATDHPKTRSSVSIWSLYIEFEVRQGQPKRAKTLVHRALVECPWAKDLYLMPFTAPFRSVYRSHELRKLHRLMLEKGIRLYGSLEATVEGWRSEVSEDEEDIGALETEDSLYAQKEAAERLRLLPL